MKSKKFISVLINCTIILSLATPIFATESTTPTKNAVIETTLDRANALKDLGLFAGTDKGFELDYVPNRTQAIIFLLRMLGEEKAAQESSYTSPFTDVPAWASNYVSYAYAKGYTSGTSKTTFGTYDVATPEQFVTFMIRALGYNDKAGEFNLSTAIKKAEELQILPADKYQNGAKDFYRGDCVDIIYSMLSAKKKGSDTTLAESLIENGAIDSTIAAKYGFGKPTVSNEALIDLSSKRFSNDLRISFITAQDRSNDKGAMIYFQICPTDIDITPLNIYLSKDGTSYEKLKIKHERDNSVTPYAFKGETRHYLITNLQFDTEYTLCIESKLDEFITPITIKTAGAQAGYSPAFTTGYVSKSSGGKYTWVGVETKILQEGDWSYQFYQWKPGSEPVAIPGASGVKNGPISFIYEPTSEDLNSYIFCRVTNDDGIIIANTGVYVEYIVGMPFKN